ncbi:hypothetical protein E2C01_034267 [Portunus trituberculatus]|uniref:Uncharacterized protein n=1 Tax=Portunus trituberculatus TaxID=210409 RepID=A0A5B7F2E4_PORTR|nr:hypothetical protein [Portunus trituberculatus]
MNTYFMRHLKFSLKAAATSYTLTIAESRVQTRPAPHLPAGKTTTKINTQNSAKVNADGRC